MTEETANNSPATPQGRDEVSASLLAATERLCAEGQPSSFTVRRIASEAGVTTSLLYFYFGSKDELVLATVRSIAADVDASVAESVGIAAMASDMRRLLEGRPAFARLLAWFVLEGRSLAELAEDPFLARLVSAFADFGSPDPTTDAGAVVTRLLGDALFAGDVNRGLGRTRDDTRLFEALKGCVEYE